MIESEKLKKYTYLKHFPIPFLEDFVRGQVIPFVGAGFSKNANIPQGKEMPDWNRLGEMIAKDLPTDYEYSNPMEAISTYEQEYSRAKLVEKLNELLLTSYIKPGGAHDAFSKIPFELVCTTNFDFLLENSYEKSGIYCRPIIDEDHLAINNLNKKDISLLKIHGDLHHPKRLVVSEEDYDSFLARYPMLATFLANLLISKTCFFVGYSLDDPDFRQIWQLIKDRLGKLRRQAFVLGVGASKQSVAKYERRGVKVINLPSNSKKSYGQILEEVFTELKEFWSNELPNFQTTTEEDIKTQLSLNTDNYSRICFFSIPLRYTSYYKKYIFPIVVNYNFVPVTADEFILTGNNILATISSLIDKSSIIIIDITSDSTKTELGIILSRKMENKNVIIIDDSYNITDNTYGYKSSDLSRLITINRPKNFLEDADIFMQIFEKRFGIIASNLQQDINNEARRLFDKNEYAAAVISAVTLFEDVLRNRLDKDTEQRTHLYSLSRLLDLAANKEFIKYDQVAELKEWIAMRNRFVHSSDRQITRQLAKKIIDSIHDTITYIQLRY